MHIKNPYHILGFVLLITGSIVSLTSYYIFEQTWITALGIVLLILAFILIALAWSVPTFSVEVSNILFDTGIENIATIIEELGIKHQAIYLPSSISGGQPKALIPLHSNPTLPNIIETLPHRFIVRFGSQPNDMGILVSTIGSTAVGMLDVKPGPSSEELESTLTYLFKGMLDVADRVKVIRKDKIIQVEVGGLRIKHKNSWYNQCLGGPIGSIVASLTAEAWDRQVLIKKEEYRRNKCIIEVEVGVENL